MKARFPGKCSECDEDIVKGKEIAKNEDGNWVHKHCVDEVLAVSYTHLTLPTILLV